MTNRWTDWLQRVSLWQLFLLIGLVAAGFGMLRFPNVLVTSLAESALCLMAILAILIAIYGQRQSRAFWIGGLIAGFLFFSLSKGSLPLFEYRPDLVTSQLNVQLFTAMYPEQAGNLSFNPYSPPTYGPLPPGYASSYGYSRVTTLTPAPGVVVVKNYVDSSSFLRICDCLWALIVAMCGGFVALTLQRRARISIPATSLREDHHVDNH